MDRKVRIRHSKREGKYTIDYSRVADRGRVRLDILTQINKSHELLLMINTGIDMYQSIVNSGRYPSLDEEKHFASVQAFLLDSGLKFRLIKGKKEFTKSLMGFPTGKTELRQISLLALALGKGQLSKELFETVGCSHDLMIGLEPSRPADALLDDFEAGKFDAINQVNDLAYTMIDSQWLGYFYTDFDPAGLE